MPNRPPWYSSSPEALTMACRMVITLRPDYNKNSSSNQWEHNSPPLFRRCMITCNLAETVDYRCLLSSPSQSIRTYPLLWMVMWSISKERMMLTNCNTQPHQASCKPSSIRDLLCINTITFSMKLNRKVRQTVTIQLVATTLIESIERMISDNIDWVGYLTRIRQTLYYLTDSF